MFSAEINTYYCHSTGGTLYKGMLSDKGHIILVLCLRKDIFNLKAKSLIWVEDKTSWREAQTYLEEHICALRRSKAPVVIPRIYLGRTLTQDPQAVARKRASGKNLKDRTIWSSIETLIFKN